MKQSLEYTLCQTINFATLQILAAHSIDHTEELYYHWPMLSIRNVRSKHGLVPDRIVMSIKVYFTE